MLNKPFDKKLYDENDPKGKEALTKHLLKSGYTNVDTTENYKYDAAATDLEGNVVLFEVEVAGIGRFESIKNKYGTVSIRYKRCKSPADILITMNNECTEMCWIRKELAIKEEYLIKKRNYYGVELFYHVPKELFSFDVLLK